MPSLSMIRNEPGVVETSISSGKVRATVLVPAAGERVWEAITRRELVSMWFGDLSADIVAGQSIRLDFGDGDFFVIEGARAAVPNRLEYSWRFLGTGPQDRIAWDIEDRGHKCFVMVTDHEPARTRKACVELAEGWTDFLKRLERHLRTGDLTRYDWRRDFDGNIVLPVPASDAMRVLSDHRGRSIWSPFEKALGKEPVHISALKWKGLRCVEFQLLAAGWKHTTACRLEIVSRSRAS